MAETAAAALSNSDSAAPLCRIAAMRYAQAPSLEIALNAAERNRGLDPSPFSQPVRQPKADHLPWPTDTTIQLHGTRKPLS